MVSHLLPLLLYNHQIVFHTYQKGKIAFKVASTMYPIPKQDEIEDDQNGRWVQNCNFLFFDHSITPGCFATSVKYNKIVQHYNELGLKSNYSILQSYFLILQPSKVKTENRY